MITLITGFIVLCLAVFAVWLSTVLYMLLAIVLCAGLSVAFALTTWATGGRVAS